MTVIPVEFVAPVEPDVAQALEFFATLFPAGRGESIHFRGVPEPKDNRPPQNLHYALDEHFRDNVRGFLEWCKIDRRAAFFLPGTVRGTGTGKADVTSLPAILVDFDKGNPDENLRAAETLIGPATIILESGGRTEHGAKLHAYWKLDHAATGDIDIAACCRVREALAEKFSGDPAFKQAAQVIRLPGSVHYKGAPKLVQLRTVRPEAVYRLEDIAAKVVPPAKADNSNVVNTFDFNNTGPLQSMTDRVLTAPVHEGGVDDITRFQAVGKALGHFIRMVRDGRMPPDEAWRAACEWNAATLVPPWDEDRLAQDWHRLIRIDMDARGPFVPPQEPALPAAAPTGWSLTDWRADRFSGPAPVRQWLVEGLIPLSTPGLFAAVGDAGKSMLALQLALHVTTAKPLDSAAVMDLSAPKFFGSPIVGRGAAVILTAEDDAAEVHRRLNSLDPTERRRGAPLIVVPMLSAGGARSILADGPAGPYPTEFWSQLRAQLLAIPDLRLVVLDPLSSFVGADINKDNLAGAALMTMLGELAATSGAAVMLVHHFAKATMPTSLSDARGSIRGAGALVDNGRWAMVLWEAEEKEASGILKALGHKDRTKQAGLVYFGGLAKGNAPGAKVMRTLVRAKSGVLEDVTETIAASMPRADEATDAVYKALCAYRLKHDSWTFQTSKNRLEAVARLLKAVNPTITARMVTNCMDGLIECGLVVEDEGGKPGEYVPFMN